MTSDNESIKMGEQDVKAWAYGVFPEQEARIGRELVALFNGFIDHIGLAGKSKTTILSYQDGLFCLGDAIIKRAIQDEENREKSGRELLEDAIDDEGGPIAFDIDDPMQAQIDRVSKKLYKYLVRQPPKDTRQS